MSARRAVLLLLTAAAGSVAAQTFRERVEVDLVRVELLAMDAKGRAIEGLKPEEIHVKVDGRPVLLDGFEAPSAAVRAVELSPVPAGRTSVAAGAAEAAPTAPQPAGAERPRYYMAILADETSSEQSNRQATFKGLFDFLQDPLPPDVEVLLMRFDGSLHVECPWTSDPGRLRRAAVALGRRRAAARIGPPGNLMNAPEGATVNATLEAMEATAHVRSSLAGIFDALRVFPETRGRKQLYVITDGAPFLGSSEISRDIVATTVTDASPNDPVAQRRAALDAERDRDLLVDSLAWDRKRSASLLTDVTRLALLRGVEIHPVRSAPHDLGNRVTAERGFHRRATVGGGAPLNPRSLRDQTSIPTTDIAAGQGMEAMAETTGGEAVLSRRFFDDSLRQEVATKDEGYALTFRDPYKGDHRFHRIEVSIDRPAAQLRYRRGYRVLDAREALVEGVANRMHLPADQNPLGVRLQVDSLGIQNGSAIADITVAYPAPPQAGGAAPEPAAVRVLGICAVRNGKLSEPIDLGGTAEVTFLDGASWRVRSGRVRLKPGAYRWSFAVRDEQTGIMSYLTFDRALP